MNDVINTHTILDNVLSVVAEKLNVDISTLTPDMDLFAAGLDSITLMSLVARWRSEGYNVDFASLAREPLAEKWVPFFAAPAIVNHTIQTENITQKADNDDRPFPLAPMQYAYWLGRDPNQPLGGVSAHLYTEFHRDGNTNRAELDSAQLKQALELLSKRHGSLRLQVTNDGQQRQLAPGHCAHLHINDWRELTSSDAETRLQECRERFSSQMLDIESGEVLAVALSLLPNGAYRLHLDIDMIAADAVSYRILLRELALLYENLDTSLPELPMTYRDCRLASERRWSDVKNGAGHWWQQRLPSLPLGPQLPLKHAQTNTGAPEIHTTRRHFHFDSALRSALYSQCQAHGLTPSAVLATVLAETLAGWSSEPHFLLNVPLFLRPMDGPDASGVVGDFSSSVLLEIDTREQKSFTDSAKQVQSRLHEDAAHAEYGGVHVMRDLGRIKGQQVTAPIVFTSALNLGELFDQAVRRVFGDPVWIISQGPQVLLDAQITELDEGLLLNWDCREDAFVDGVLDAMFDFFRQSVVALADESNEAWTERLSSRLPKERAKPEVVRSDISGQPSPTVLPVTPPQTPIEHAVSALWQEIIGNGGDDVNQNLFAAGGDSMLANALVAQIREIFGVHTIDMRRLFNAPTIAGLSNSITSAGNPEEMHQIAEMYCEILQLDDSELMAEFSEEAQV